MKRCGLSKIDMWGGAPHYCRLDYNSSREAGQKIAQLRRAMDDLGMQVVIYTPETLGYPFSYSTPDFPLRSRTLDYMKAAMEDALLFGTNRVFLNTGCHSRDLNREEGFLRTADSYRALCDTAERMGVDLILEQLQLDQNEMDMIEHIVVQMEKEGGMDRSAAIADMRFDFIEYVCERTVKKPKESKERLRSEKIDRILTGKWTAIPCFVAIMGAVFFLTFNVIGAFLQGLLESGIEALTAAVDQWMTAAHVNHALHGLVIDGIFGGVGSVLSFLPIVVTLFFFLSIMEDSGYVARVAFFMDKLLRKIGLSGRSIVPMLIGFGCTVPAVMATRTLPSKRDRKMTIFLTPFMSCTAKLPIYVFFVSAFFPGKGGFIMTGLYLLGIAVGILVALLFKNTLFKGEAVPFVMELPNYRMPGVKNVAQLLWEKAKDFLSKAFSVILIATIVVWFLQSFDLHLNMVADSSDSLMAMISGWIAPVLAPLGLGDWRIVTSLISGFMAKESVVSTMEILFGCSIQTAISTVSAATMLVFSLLYTPCVAAIASIKRELGAKWAVGVVFWQCAVAWIAAFIARFICIAVGM